MKLNILMKNLLKMTFCALMICSSLNLSKVRIQNVNSKQTPPAQAGQAAASAQGGSSAPFNPTSAIQLAKDIAGVALPTDQQTQSVFQGCIKFIVENPAKYTNALSTFWSNMGNVATQKSKWEKAYLQDVINSVSSLSVLVGTQKASCGNLNVIDAADVKKIGSLLNNYFGGFNSAGGKKMPFIDGMISSHRNMIKPDTFGKINESSRQK